MMMIPLAALVNPAGGLACRDGVEGAFRAQGGLGVGIEACTDAHADGNAQGRYQNEGCRHQRVLEVVIACRHKG